MPRYLNLGCGQRFHPDWVNVDFTATGPGVIAHDLLNGIPFPTESFSVVYHAHVLEHFPRSQVPQFLGECRRVLKPGGIIRTVVPDLEQIARLYLSALEGALAEDPVAAKRREWMVLELCDQMTRNKSGGEMANRLATLDPELLEFVSSRLGVEMRWWRPTNGPIGQVPSPVVQSRTRLRKFLSLFRSPAPWREFAMRQLLSRNDFLALQIGRFRQAGEIHQWMYDRIAISELLATAGFVEIERQTHLTSTIPDWAKWKLDSTDGDNPAKPDSLYMEAHRT